MELEKFVDCFNDMFIFVLSEDKKELIYPNMDADKGKQTVALFSILEKKDDGTFFNPYTRQVYEYSERKTEIDSKIYNVIRLIEVTKYKNLVNQYILDETTGLYLRKKLLISLNEYLKMAVRNMESFSLTMLDIDFFKKINDTYGHQFGDLVLNDLAQLLNMRVNANHEKKGILGRYGGEEFIFTINNTDYQYAKERNEHIRENIEHELKYVNDEKIDLTCSFGTVFVNYDQIDDVLIDDMSSVRSKVDSIIKCADKNLYKSKQFGRNTVTMTNYTK